MSDELTLADFASDMHLIRLDVKRFVREPVKAVSEQFRKRLHDFKERVSPGDEIYSYISEDEQWRVGMGSSGFIRVRNGLVVDSLVRMMN